MKIRTLAGLGLLLASQLVQSQSAGPNLPLWEIGAFGGAVATPAYPGSVDRASRALIAPVLFYRGKIFRVDRSGIGARVMRTDDMEFDIGFAASLPASSQDVAARQNMPDLGTLFEFGPRLKLNLARPGPDSRVSLELPLRAVQEINGGIRNQGVAMEPSLNYDTRNLFDGWNASVAASLVLGDVRLNQYLYAVDPLYATATRPTYSAKAGLIATRFGITLTKRMTPDLRVFGFTRYETYAGAANLDSPLHLRSNGLSTGLGVMWIFGRSEERAQD